MEAGVPEGRVMRVSFSVSTDVWPLQVNAPLGGLADTDGVTGRGRCLNLFSQPAQFVEFLPPFCPQ